MHCLQLAQEQSSKKKKEGKLFHPQYYPNPPGPILLVLYVYARLPSKCKCTVVNSCTIPLTAITGVSVSCIHPSCRGGQPLFNATPHEDGSALNRCVRLKHHLQNNGHTYYLILVASVFSGTLVSDCSFVYCGQRGNLLLGPGFGYEIQNGECAISRLLLSLPLK